jgi:hypothetical protein
MSYGFEQRTKDEIRDFINQYHQKKDRRGTTYQVLMDTQVYERPTLNELIDLVIEDRYPTPPKAQDWG